MKILLTLLSFGIIISGCSGSDDDDEIVIANNANNVNNANNTNNNVDVLRPNIEGTEIVDRVIYNDGELLKATPYGISFVLPDGFSGEVSEDFFLIYKDGNDEAAILLAGDRTTIDDAVTELGREIELVDEFVSTPVGDPQVVEDIVSVSSTVTDGEVNLSGRLRVGVGPFGVGVFIGVIASDAFLSEFVTAGASIESSIKFTEATLPVPKVVAFEWSFLSGAAVTNSYSNTGISYSETLRIDLCTDGTYKRRFSGGDAEFTFFDDEVGEWSVSGTRDEGQLVMYSTEGKTREIFPMAYQDDGLFTVGDRDYSTALDIASCE